MWSAGPREQFVFIGQVTQAEHNLYTTATPVGSGLPAIDRRAPTLDGRWATSHMIMAFTSGLRYKICAADSPGFIDWHVDTETDGHWHVGSTAKMITQLEYARARMITAGGILKQYVSSHFMHVRMHMRCQAGAAVDIE